jgi:N-carbamoylputrescine amidase
VKEQLRLALIQLAWTGDQRTLLAQYRDMIAQAAAQGAEMVCLPEFSLAPYFPGTRDEAGFAWAERIASGLSARFFSQMASEYAVFVVGSLYEWVDNGGLYDTATVHAPTGDLVATTRKIHIPSGDSYHETDFFAGSDQFPVVQLEPITLATPTCYDQWFPELARIYSLGGAELIVYPTAIGSEPNDPTLDTQAAWETMMRGHAIANGVFVAAVNRVGVENGVAFYGSSFVCAPSGQILAQAGRDSHEVVVADLNVSQLTQWRHYFPLLHQRRPELYGQILQRWQGDKRPLWVEDTPVWRTKPKGQ